MDWLIDNGWIRLGLAYDWFNSEKAPFVDLVNVSDLSLIEKRYKLIEKSGVFSGKKGPYYQQAFIEALFAYDPFKADAFSKALAFSHSWSGKSSEPLNAFLNFISRTFFNGPTGENNKQTFINSVLRQNNGEHNALAHAAWVKNPSSKIEKNPLTLLLNSLTEAGCFTGANASENKQKMILAICKHNANGENALYKALASVGISNIPYASSNIKILLDTLAKSDCFNDSSNERNVRIFIQGVLDTGKYVSVLSQAMFDTNSLQAILSALTDLGCFENEQNSQAFINALCTPDCLGRNVFHYSYNNDSYKLIYQYLKKIGCFTSLENKQKLIKAILSQDHSGESALSHASEDTQNRILLNMLSEADCFRGSVGNVNQQAFIEAALALNEKGRTCLYDDDNSILKQLMNIKYLEGPFAEKNKRSLIKAMLTPMKIGNELYGNALSHNCNDDMFQLFMENLATADCFARSPDNANKKVFLDAVFDKTSRNQSLISTIYKPENIILLLQKLEEVGCFSNKETQLKFRQAVRTNENALLFHTLKKDGKSYLVLHRCLLLAGCSKEDIKKLLNEPAKQSYDYWSEATPLMIALRNKDDLLAERLIADGAELTEQQKQLVQQHFAKVQINQMSADKVTSLHTEHKINEKPEVEESHSFEQRGIKRKSSFSNLSLLASKVTHASLNSEVDAVNLTNMTLR